MLQTPRGYNIGAVIINSNLCNVTLIVRPGFHVSHFESGCGSLVVSRISVRLSAGPVGASSQEVVGDVVHLL
jgi:hypothetical protein